ncbi:MAG: tripartite tricarboxylate transporter substrate binding protein [Proteobacteria bacterium]|nr:tripartite tricarboxylate transporter substrate binding protein [Burkholderiales bacterium]
MIRTYVWFSLGAWLACSALAAAAQTFPAKSIRLVVPFGAGSISDILARTVAIPLAENVGQQVVIDNRPGAGGNIGGELVVRAPPDGYTIVLGAASVLAVNGALYSTLPYDPVTAFAPITLMVRTTNVLVIDPALPVKSVKELIAWGRANPGKLTFASAGAGGTIHLSGELFRTLTGLDIVHIPYKASPLAHVDILGGQVQMMFDGMPTALPQIKAGRLRALAVTTARRSALMPDLPTMAEAGLPGYEAAGWFGFAAPAKTPPVTITVLNREIVKILRGPEVRDRLIQQGAEPVGDTPEEFGTFIRAEAAKWGKIIKALGIKAD